MQEHHMTASIMKLKESIATLNEKTNATFRRLDEQKELTDSVHALAISIERQTAQLKHQAKELSQLKHEVEELKATPRRRWETIITAIISVVIGAVVALIGAK